MYQPQPYIGKELLKFSNDNFIVKQVQQFLIILNYIRDSIPHVAKHTSQLSKLLKKNSPPCSPEKTKAIQELKKIAQNPPVLKILGIGKIILQTDANDHFWGAILIEEVDHKR
ncbi:uncharacterized protein LOC133301091 [Gastrolobium bilobum]|uniref:uncharacterized protein LOC133301091 n=1 Tax=Gastrolobium bilobum TaxID=150636 RepID=UPI002AB0FA43|nr:uncharacterized protein LOC133301091 [Gastrolobium bilobum]